MSDHYTVYPGDDVVKNVARCSLGEKVPGYKLVAMVSDNIFFVEHGEDVFLCDRRHINIFVQPQVKREGALTKRVAAVRKANHLSVSPNVVGIMLNRLFPTPMGDGIFELNPDNWGNDITMPMHLVGARAMEIPVSIDWDTLEVEDVKLYLLSPEGKEAAVHVREDGTVMPVTGTEMWVVTGEEEPEVLLDYEPVRWSGEHWHAEYNMRNQHVNHMVF